MSDYPNLRHIATALNYPANLCGTIDEASAALAEIERQADEIEQLRKQWDDQVGEGRTIADWQDAIRNTLIEAQKDDELLLGECAREIDGAGCDSGDPLDLTLSEVCIATAAYSDALLRQANEIERLRADNAVLAAEVTSLRLYAKFVPSMIDDDAMHEKMSDYRTGARAARAVTDAAGALERAKTAMKATPKETP